MLLGSKEYRDFLGHRAYEKLRSQQLKVKRLSVFVQTNRFREDLAQKIRVKALVRCSTPKKSNTILRDRKRVS